MSTLMPERVDVQLVTIPNVELITVGEWNASTGPVTFTEQDLKAAIAALDDPAIHQPRLRIGHTPPNVGVLESAGGFEEQPAFGRFVNLRLADNGSTIIADAVGVPAWLAEILPAAFPSRSIEAYFDVTTAAGRKHDMVITSVALLGVSMPACQTLEDLRLAFGAEMPDGVELQFTGARVAASQGEAMPKRVSASVTYSDVRTSFYNDFATQESGRYWWWICDFVMSPATVIADDDEGGLWSVPYTLDGETIAWGDPVEVRTQYVEKDTGKVAASRMTDASDDEDAGDHFFKTAAESRPTDRVRAATTPEGGDMNDEQRVALAAQLGLPEDATDEQITEAVTAAKAQADKVTGLEEELATARAAAEKGDRVDPDAIAALQEDARLGREAREQQINAERESIVDERVRAGAITSASRDAHLAELARGGEIEKTHRTYLASLKTGVVPVAPIVQAEEHQNGASYEAVRASFGLKPKETISTGKGN